MRRGGGCVCGGRDAHVTLHARDGGAHVRPIPWQGAGAHSVEELRGCSRRARPAKNGARVRHDTPIWKGRRGDAPWRGGQAERERSPRHHPWDDAPLLVACHSHARVSPRPYGPPTREGDAGPVTPIRHVHVGRGVQGHLAACRGRARGWRVSVEGGTAGGVPPGRHPSLSRLHAAGDARTALRGSDSSPKRPAPPCGVA